MYVNTGNVYTIRMKVFADPTKQVLNAAILAAGNLLNFGCTGRHFKQSPI